MTGNPLLNAESFLVGLLAVLTLGTMLIGRYRMALVLGGLLLLDLLAAYITLGVIR